MDWQAFVGHNGAAILYDWCSRTASGVAHDKSQAPSVRDHRDGYLRLKYRECLGGRSPYQSRRILRLDVAVGVSVGVDRRRECWIGRRVEATRVHVSQC